MLQEKLKQATQQNHDELEQLMFVTQIMDNSLTPEQYKQVLTTNYLTHREVEDKLFNALSPATSILIDLNKRRKMDGLTKDMQEAKLDVDQPAPVPAPLFLNDGEILGALYVLEGATLGGNVIVKRLKTNPQLNSQGLGFYYYQVYGEDLVPLWKGFCAILNQQPEDTYADSIAGAKKMFGYIAQVQQAQ